MSDGGIRELLRPLVDYNYWANGRLLEAAGALPAGALTRELGTEWSFPSLHRMFAHVMGAEALWLARWRGVDPAGLEPADGYDALPALRARWEAVERDFRAYLEPLDDAALRRAIDYRTLDGRPSRSVLWQMVQHVVNHGTHHRSEAAAMLTRLGHAPPPLDLILYYRTRAD